MLVADYEHIRRRARPSCTWSSSPVATTSSPAGAFTGDRFLSIKLRDVATVVEVLTPGTWQSEPLPGVPENTNTGLAGVDAFGDEIFLSTSGFDKPPRLLHGPSAGPVRRSSPRRRSSTPTASSSLSTSPTSADGTRVPYFLVAHRDSTGPAPHPAGRLRRLSACRSCRATSVVFGRLWLARGGTYAMANIRGGGEYGPAWHEQAVRENRHKVAEDFAAVARDLVADGRHDRRAARRRWAAAREAC